MSARDRRPWVEWLRSEGEPVRGSRQTQVQATVLFWVAAGVAVDDALGRVGRSADTLKGWRRDRQFREGFRYALSRTTPPTVRHDPLFTGRDHNKVIEVRRERDMAFAAGVEVPLSPLAEFRSTCFGHDTPPHLSALVDALESAPAMSVTLVLLFPNSGKTTTLEEYCCWRIGRDRSVKILFGCETNGKALKRVSRIANNLRDNERVTGVFGQFYEQGQERLGRSWTKSKITVLGAPIDEQRDYTLEAAGITESVDGNRANLIILDDVQTPETRNMTDKVLEAIRSTWYLRLDPDVDSRMVVIGNRFDQGDIYGRLISEGMVDRLVVIPAVGPVNLAGVHVPDGRSVWPARWPDDKLATIRAKSGPSVWAARYMQAPHLSGDATFTAQMVESAFDASTEVGVPPAGVDDIWLSVDPALGGRSFILACVAGLDGVTVLDCEAASGDTSTEQWITRIDLWASRFDPSTVIIEAGTMGKGLQNDHRLRQLGVDRRFRVLSHTTNQSKNDPRLGVAAMAGGFERGEIRFAGTGLVSRLDPLVNDLRSWRPVLTRGVPEDGVMALWFAWKRWADSRPARTGVDHGWRSKGLPWRPFSLGKVG